LSLADTLLLNTFNSSVLKAMAGAALNAEQAGIGVIPCHYFFVPKLNRHRLHPLTGSNFFWTDKQKSADGNCGAKYRTLRSFPQIAV